MVAASRKKGVDQPGILVYVHALLNLIHLKLYVCMTA